MRELQCIIRVPLHPNIVRLFEVHRTASSTLCYVFEYMPDGSLHDLLHARSLQRLPPLPTAQIQSLIRQILSGLAHLHRFHQMHRDMKPENILLCQGTAKVADFSLARCCATEANDPITSYVSTRWYRAPEVLLQVGQYDCQVDNFAVGCMAAEMCRQRALFTGKNELDQLSRIFQVTGTPASPQQCWNVGVERMQAMGLQEPQQQSQLQSQHAAGGPRDKLEHFLMTASAKSSASLTTTDMPADRDNNNNNNKNLVDFVWGLLALNPDRRLTADEALRHPYLQQKHQQNQQKHHMTATTSGSATWTPAEDKTSTSSKLVTVSPAAVVENVENVHVPTHMVCRRDLFSS